MTQRSQLLSYGSSAPSVPVAIRQSDSLTNEEYIAKLKNDQADMIKIQDGHLDDISIKVKKLDEMARAINNETVAQTNILSNINTDVDNAQTGLSSTNNRIKILLKSTKCSICNICDWRIILIIILILIAIILLAIIIYA
jgi:t-SNARE complex subunit (syntaxin)